ncbi:MAG: hypothetical protein FJY67_10460 [Calditrichaeota bacterium]|nr:hypothetical protein [Calditrichota bacterium]
MIAISLVARLNAAPAPPAVEGWLQPPPQEQLYAEGFDDQKGMGRIFVPAMTNPNSEPPYAVFLGDLLIAQQNTGSSAFVSPGTYKVVFGTGTIEQRIVKEVTVRREETVIIEPDWGALTIEVIDESRSYFSHDLQIFRVSSAESYGVIPAISPELGEQMQTLILAPGLYKIVKRGRDFNTFINFATVYLETGNYTPFTLVIESTTGNFTGAGILAQSNVLRQLANLRGYLAIHGNMVLNSDNRTSRSPRTDISVLAQVENRLIFDRFPHYYLSNNLLDLGTQKLHNTQFTIKPDRLQLKNTYIYYLLKWLGGYSRLDLGTHFLPVTSVYDRPVNVTFHNEGGRVMRYLRGVQRAETAPAFFPLELKEGVGVNLTPLRSYNARLSVRSGFGFRQSVNKDVYQPTDVDTVFKAVPDINQRGWEASLVSNFTFFQNLGLTTELDVLFPIGAQDDPVIDLSNFVSFALTKNVTLEHTFRLKHDRTLYTYNIIEQLISVRLSYYFL